MDGDKPFSMHPDRRGWSVLSSGLERRSAAVHFEPWRRTVTNPLLSGAAERIPQQTRKNVRITAYAFSAGRFAIPLRADTYRLTEHHTGRRHEPIAEPSGGTPAGIVCRNLAAIGGRESASCRTTGSHW